MAQIGYVQRQEDGSYQGQLQTLSIKAALRIAPNESKRPDTNQPDYRIHSRGVELGAGWIRTSASSGQKYVSLSFEAPEFGQRRLYANLGQAADQDDPDVFAIIWNPSD